MTDDDARSNHISFGMCAHSSTIIMCIVLGDTHLVASMDKKKLFTIHPRLSVCAYCSLCLLRFDVLYNVAAKT